MRVLVCGGRDFHDETTVTETLDSLHGQRSFSILIHGCARGADTLAEKWAIGRGLPTIGRKADWQTHGKSAGILRNILMLNEDKPDLVIAFPGGKGTAHMIKIAREAGVEVIEVKC